MYKPIRILWSLWPSRMSAKAKIIYRYILKKYQFLRAINYLKKYSTNIPDVCFHREVLHLHTKLGHQLRNKKNYFHVGYGIYFFVIMTVLRVINHCIRTLTLFTAPISITDLCTLLHNGNSKRTKYTFFSKTRKQLNTHTSSSSQQKQTEDTRGIRNTSVPDPDSCLWEPEMDPDSTIFVIGFQEPTKNCFLVFLLITFWRYI